MPKADVARADSDTRAGHESLLSDVGGNLAHDMVPLARLDAVSGVALDGGHEPSACNGLKTMIAGKELPS